MHKTGTRRAAIGLRAHSGWAALVVVGGSAESPEILDRRRIELAEESTAAAVQPYHEAQGLNIKEARKIIERYEKQAQRFAERALSHVVRDIAESGYLVEGCAVLVGPNRKATSLEKVLASHPLLHAAEGELFRNALIRAGENCGLKVTAVRERDLYERAASQLRLSGDALRSTITELGRLVGSPWQQDQKHAALAAWTAL